jgi:acetyl esterase/lipase
MQSVLLEIENMRGRERKKTMREQIALGSDEFTNMIGLTSEVVYMQKPYWCNVTERQLKLSVIRPRYNYQYDTKRSWPLIVFICGGAWQKLDRNVWVPELSWFAKRGFIVACVEYSVLPYTEYPEPLEEIKAAIRYLRANAEKFSIRKDQVIVSGESAGGYLAALVAATNGDPRYEKGPCLEESSEVKLAVPFYPPTGLQLMNNGKLRVRTDNFEDICDLVTENTVPMYLVHGMADDQVPYEQSVRLYEKLQACGVDSQLTLIEGANHADPLCFRTEIKERMLQFIKQHL